MSKLTLKPKETAMPSFAPLAAAPEAVYARTSIPR